LLGSASTPAGALTNLRPPWPQSGQISVQLRSTEATVTGTGFGANEFLVLEDLHYNGTTNPSLVYLTTVLTSPGGTFSVQLQGNWSCTGDMTGAYTNSWFYGFVPVSNAEPLGVVC
jgi:hypothetical protein